MISDGYFVDLDYPLYEDPTPETEESLAVELHGKVIFDLGEVSHPSFGTVHIKGEFPRIKPRKARDAVTDSELEGLKTRLRVWVDKFFDREANPTYFEDLIHSSALFTAYINPFHDIGSSDMELAMMTYFWLWHTDDVLEMAVETNIPFAIVDEGLNQFITVLRGETKKFAEVEGCPGFRRLFDSLLTIQQLFEERSFGYEDIAESFIFFLKRYFGAMRWFSVERIEGAYSEETFRFWRRIIAYFDGIAEVILMLHRLQLPKKVVNSPSLRRILDITNSIGGFINDVLGLSKEIKYKQRDNLVLFKVLQKGIPVDEAVSQVCALIKSELTDYIMLRDAILYEFSHHPILIKYIDILEALMDGHNQIYAHSHRHLSAGKVQVLR